MSEDKNNQDPIEKLFERKVWDYDISYNESDWMELEDRLDILDKQHSNRNRRHWIAAAAIVLFSLLGYFTYHNYSQINQISRLLSSDETTKIQQDQSQDDLASQEETDTESIGGEEEHLSSDTRNPNVQENNPGEQALPPSSNEQNDNITTGQGTGNLSPATAEGEALFVAELTCSDCGLSQQIITNTPSTLSRIEMNKPEDARPISALAANNNDNITRSSPNISLGILMGPDLSTVGAVSNFYDPGYTIGIKAEYSINSRLSINAGIQRSQVRYTASSNEYTPPSGYWTNGIVADETIGECALIDIPINLKYNFLQFGNSRLYATGGFSSYIMLHEEYRYNYEDQPSGLVQDWSGKTGTRHWMSNADFSIGYELDIHSNWSIRAEPYVKIPIKKVGWGNVDLYSTGSVFSLNYRFKK